MEMVLCQYNFSDDGGITLTQFSKLAAFEATLGFKQTLNLSLLHKDRNMIHINCFVKIIE